MIEMASVLKSSTLTEYSFTFRFPNLQWNIKLVTLFHPPAAPFDLWSCEPEMIYNCHNYWLFFFCAVIWLDSDNSRLSFLLSKIVLIVTWVSGIVKSFWSEDVVAKHFIGPNTPFLWVEKLIWQHRSGRAVCDQRGLWTTCGFFL